MAFAQLLKGGPPIGGLGVVMGAAYQDTLVRGATGALRHPSVAGVRAG